MTEASSEAVEEGDLPWTRHVASFSPEAASKRLSAGLILLPSAEKRWPPSRRTGSVEVERALWEADVAQAAYRTAEAARRKLDLPRAAVGAVRRIVHNTDPNDSVAAAEALEAIGCIAWNYDDIGPGTLEEVA